MWLREVFSAWQRAAVDDRRIARADVGRLLRAISESTAAVHVWARPGFDTFLAIPRLRFEPFDCQLRAARTVLRRMRGRAILADELGLGKTIEAGLVLSELRMRGLADKVNAPCWRRPRRS